MTDPYRMQELKSSFSHKLFMPPHDEDEPEMANINAAVASSGAHTGMLPGSMGAYMQQPISSSALPPNLFHGNPYSVAQTGSMQRQSAATSLLPGARGTTPTNLPFQPGTGLPQGPQGVPSSQHSPSRSGLSLGTASTVQQHRLLVAAAAAGGFPPGSSSSSALHHSQTAPQLIPQGGALSHHPSLRGPPPPPHGAGSMFPTGLGATNPQSGLPSVASAASLGQYTAAHLQQQRPGSSGHGPDLSSHQMQQPTVSMDLSEFPALQQQQAVGRPQQTSGVLQQPLTRNYVDTIVSGGKGTVGTAIDVADAPGATGAVGGHHGFQIQQEDFPALPGAQNPPALGATGTDTTPKGVAPIGSVGPVGSVVHPSTPAVGKFPGDKSVSTISSTPGVGSGSTPNSGGKGKGIQTLPDGRINNIPGSMLADAFGITGLLAYIRHSEQDPSIGVLTPGVDLTTLGLNLNAAEPTLYSKFQSPWSDTPCRPQDIDYPTPIEYNTNMYIKPKLSPFNPHKYSEELLFFIFYVCCGDLWQNSAAAELYARDWRYHREERLWITKMEGAKPIQKTSTSETGMFYYWDIQSWSRVSKQFLIEYDKLEERPNCYVGPSTAPLPPGTAPALHQFQQQPQQQQHPSLPSHLQHHQLQQQQLQNQAGQAQTANR